jgi:hypothetical protein
MCRADALEDPGFHDCAHGRVHARAVAAGREHGDLHGARMISGFQVSEGKGRKVEA